MRKFLIASAAVMLALGSAGVGSAQDPRQLACDPLCKPSIEGAANCTAAVPASPCLSGIPTVDSEYGAHCCPPGTGVSFDEASECWYSYEENDSTSRTVVPTQQATALAKEVTTSCEVKQVCRVRTRYIEFCGFIFTFGKICQTGPKTTLRYVCKYERC